MLKRTCVWCTSLALILSIAILLLFSNVNELFDTSEHSSFSQLRTDGSSSSLFSLDSDMDHNQLLSWVRDKASKLGASLPNSSASATSTNTDEGNKNSVIMPKMGNETLRAELGRSTWHLIHVMGNRYPTKPKSHEKEAVLSFIHLLGRIYPCGECAGHFQEMLSLHPPEPHVDSRDSLSQYFCKMHNKVNLRLKHPIFDCNLVGDRWKCGCAEEDPDPTSTVINGKFQGMRPDADTSKLSSIERSLRMESRSLFPEDYAEALSQASEKPPKYPVVARSTPSV